MIVVFACLTIDRHADPEINLFMDQKDALDWAKERASEYCRDGDDVEVNLYKGDKDGWIARYTYSCEGDNILVMMKGV